MTDLGFPCPTYRLVLSFGSVIYFVLFQGPLSKLHRGTVIIDWIMALVTCKHLETPPALLSSNTYLLSHPPSSLCIILTATLYRILKTLQYLHGKTLYRHLILQLSVVPYHTRRPSFCHIIFKSTIPIPTALAHLLQELQ